MAWSHLPSSPRPPAVPANQMCRAGASSAPPGVVKAVFSALTPASAVKGNKISGMGFQNVIKDLYPLLTSNRT